MTSIGMNDFHYKTTFAVWTYSKEIITSHISPSCVLTAKVMGTCMLWNTTKNENTSKIKQFLSNVYLSSPTFLPGLPWPPRSPFSPRHLQTTLQHFLSATVSWKTTRNISMYINKKTKTDFSLFCLYHRRTYKVFLQDACNLCKANTQRFVVSKPSAKLYFPKFSQVLCIVQAN